MSERIVDWVTKEDLRRITGKDRRTIRQRLEAAGLTPRIEGRRQLFDKMLAVQAVVTKSGDPENAAKERKLAAEAEKAEIVVARLRGELVPVADMKTAAAELIKTLYARIVRVTPSILAPKVLGNTDPLEIEKILRDALADAFNELKSMPEHFLTVDPDDALEGSVSLVEELPQPPEPLPVPKKHTIEID